MTVLVAHPSGELYGSDKMLLESVVGLVERGVRVVVTLPATGPLVGRLREHGVDVVQCAAPVLRKTLLSPRGLLVLARETASGLVQGIRLIRRYKPDVVYISTSTVPLWVVIARLTRRPSVVHVHEAEGGAARALRVALAAPLCLATSVLVNSEYSAEVQEQALRALEGRTTIVHNGVAGPPEPTAPRRAIDGGAKLLYIGRLSHRKGVDVAIRALGELRRRGTTASLDVVGEVFPGNEAYGESLRALVRDQDLVDAVRFHGYHDDVWPFLAATDICLVTSRFDEPFGNTAVEALLAARPLVVSDTSGLREAAAGYESPVFVTPDQGESLADGIQRILEDWTDYRRRAEDDAATASAKHSLGAYRQNVVGKILEVVRVTG